MITWSTKIRFVTANLNVIHCVKGYEIIFRQVYIFDAQTEFQKTALPPPSLKHFRIYPRVIILTIFFSSFHADRSWEFFMRVRIACVWLLLDDWWVDMGEWVLLRGRRPASSGRRRQRVQYFRGRPVLPVTREPFARAPVTLHGQRTLLVHLV